MKLESGDNGLDTAFAHLYEATAGATGRTRVVKVDVSDLRQVLAQFKMLADAAKKSAAPHACSAACERHLDEIDAWRSGSKATPGLSAHGERYARNMREHVREHVNSLRQLGHHVPTDLG